MSDRPCNYCIHKRAKQIARRNGNRIILRRDSLRGAFPGGVGMYEIPKYVRVPRKQQPPKRNFVAWFAELPERCACDE